MSLREVFLRQASAESIDGPAPVIFAGIFLLQNRLQTACEKLQTEISMKQWLLLALLPRCPEPRTLTRVGKLMGCSRQNVKQLASGLERKGFVNLIQGDGNSLLVDVTEKAKRYFAQFTSVQEKTLDLLFAEFSPDELAQALAVFGKLLEGVENVEEMAEELKEMKK